MSEETMAKLREIIVKQMGVEPGQVHEGATWEALGMNPQTVARCYEKIGVAFKRTVGLQEMKKFETIGDIAAWLDKE